MEYSMMTPCDQCPFLKGSGFSYASLLRHSSGEFACHKACKIEEDEEGYSSFVPRNNKTPHCAGALIFNELRGAPHQMARICTRLRNSDGSPMYDPSKLDMNAPVVTSRKDCRDERPRRAAKRA